MVDRPADTVADAAFALLDRALHPGSRQTSPPPAVPCTRRVPDATPPRHNARLSVENNEKRA